MRSGAVAGVGRSLDLQGKWRSIQADETGLRVRGLASTAVTIWALILTALALSASSGGTVELGLRINSASSTVTDVSPTGYAWTEGIRPGQPIIELLRADQDGGWLLTTLGPNGPITITERVPAGLLRETYIAGVLGLVAAALGLIFLRANRRWSLPLACVGLDLATVPFAAAYHELTGLTLGLAAGVPAVWLAWRVRERRLASVGILVAAAALVGGWYISWTGGADSAAMLGIGLDITAIGGLALIVTDRVRSRLPSRPGPVTGRDVALWLTLAVATIAIGLFVAGAAPGPLVTLVPVAVALGLPPLWSRVGPRLEARLMTDIRELTAADAAEEERARIAREIHDSPLQELSATIRRLEVLPDARAEADVLRAVADELRAIAVELRPPMLDDLGLGATLDFLAEQATGPELDVTAAIDDTTQVSTRSRPPAAVELAVYRIAQEALSNAIRHSGGSRVRVTARVAADVVDLEVADNGTGFHPDRRRDAAAEGRLGLVSMRRRAQGIGADLDVRSDGGGTAVRVRWVR